MKIEETLLFSDLDKESLNKIKLLGAEKSFTPNQAIIREGEVGNEFYIILKGKVKVTQGEKILSFIKEGDFFGEMALLEDAPRSASIYSITPVIVVIFTRDEFKEILSFSPEVSLKILKTLSKRLRDTNIKMLDEIKRETRLSTIGQLAGTVIHDLKGPISVIKGYVEFLGRKNLDEKKRLEYVSIVRDELERLLNMTKDFLEFSKGKESLQLMDVDGKQLILETVNFLKEKAANKGIEIEINGEETCIKCDPMKIKRVFTNVLLNSIESMEEGKITITTKKNKDITIIVEDNGPGMSPEVREKIFDPFFTLKSGGTGLGMTIVKKIINDHSGTVIVESEKGHGTTVTITLPGCSS